MIHLGFKSHIVCFLVFIAPQLAYAAKQQQQANQYSINPQNVVKRTFTHNIKTKHLPNQQTVHVRLPIGYDKNINYPVLYVTDADFNFELVAANIDYLSYWYQIPKMIVTAAKSNNRNRDYIPRQDPHFPYTGKAENYQQFVQHDWINLIDSQYKTTNERMLLGHSFGGVFTLYSLFTKPDLFNAYFAFGTSAWIANKVLFEQADVFFKSNNQANLFVYMEVGENDGGPTRPFSEQLTEVFKQKAPKTLKWHYKTNPKTSHFTNFSSGLPNALNAYFDTWEHDKNLLEVASKKGEKGVHDWFLEQQNKLGFRFYPRIFELGVVALNLVQKQQSKPALAIMKQLSERYPGHPRVVFFTGMVNEMAGNKKSAEQAYLYAMRQVKDKGFHPNIIQLAQIEAALKRVLTN